MTASAPSVGLPMLAALGGLDPIELLPRRLWQLIPGVWRYRRSPKVPPTHLEPGQCLVPRQCRDVSPGLPVQRQPIPAPRQSSPLRLLADAVAFADIRDR